MIKKIINLALICLFLSFAFFKTKQLIPQIQTTFKTVIQEPKNKSYITDEKKYLKTYYLMKKGQGFYQAHYQAFRNLAGKEEEHVWKKDAWGWRLPLVFYFWKLLTLNGLGVLVLFIIISLITLINSYLIAEKINPKPTAFLAPLILIPYFLNPLRSTSFLFITWWAMFFFILGLMFFYRQKLFLASLFFTLAVISREHFIINLGAMLVVSLIFKKKRLVFLIPFLAFFLMTAFHSRQVSSLIELENPTGILQRLAPLNKKLLLASLAFSTNSYFLLNLRPTLIWTTASIIGLTFLSWQVKNKYPFLIALASFFPLLISLTFMDQSVWKDYWGAMVIPLTAVFSPSIFRAIKNNNSNN